MNTFDPSTHSYTISGRAVPSVTQVIHAVLGDAIWYASDFYLGKGRAVHACAALIAQGKQFEHDPVIKQQVIACRRFFEELAPEVIEVEQPIYSARYLYAGTPDLIVKIGDRIVIPDYKSSMDNVTQGLAQIQIGGYALEKPEAKWGMVVALFDNGNYKCGEMFKLDRRKQEFLACLSVFNIRKRMGLVKPKEDEDGN